MSTGDTPSSADAPGPGGQAQSRPSPTFDAFMRHARELRTMQRELRSREGADPAEIIESEAALPSVLEIAVELTLDDASRHGELSIALARAGAIPDARERDDAIAHAWAMAGETIVWESGRSAAVAVRDALRRRGLTLRAAAPGRELP